MSEHRSTLPPAPGQPSALAIAVIGSGAPADVATAIAGFHLFSFGSLRKSAEWLRSYGQQPQRFASGAGAQNP